MTAGGDGDTSRARCAGAGDIERRVADDDGVSGGHARSAGLRDVGDGARQQRVAGATCIAVATGGFSVDELRAHGAETVVPDLADTEAVIRLLA